MDNKWNFWKLIPAPREGKTKPFWVCTSKDDSVTLVYGNENGIFDFDGNGVSYSHWQHIEKPKPVKPLTNKKPQIK